MVSELEKQMGKRVRETREKAGLSREKLSEIANISAKFLYEIEVGRKGMSAITLYDVSRALNVSSEYLLTGNTQSGKSNDILALLETADANKIKDIEKLLKDILNIIS